MGREECLDKIQFFSLANSNTPIVGTQFTVCLAWVSPQGAKRHHRLTGNFWPC